MIEDVYTDTVAVPTGYFRGVAAKRNRPPGVSLRRQAGSLPTLDAKLAQRDVRATAPLPPPVSHIRRCPRLEAVWLHLGPFTVSNPGPGRKPLIHQGKDLRGLLKSIIRLRLIVIGAPATPPACLPVRVQHPGKIRQGPHESPKNPCGCHVNQYGIGSPPSVPAASRIVCGRQYSSVGGCSRSVGLDRPDDQPHPVLISLLTAGTIQHCFEVQNLDTEYKSNQSEMVQGLPRLVIPVSRIKSVRTVSALGYPWSPRT